MLLDSSSVWLRLLCNSDRYRPYLRSQYKERTGRAEFPAFIIQSNGWSGIRQIVQRSFRPEFALPKQATGFELVKLLRRNKL
jgi:hypothetical protein